MARLCLHLLGPFQAELDGRPLVGLPAKTRAMVAYLAVEAGRAHRRAALAELFWPERPPGVALANLRYALRDLHTALRDRPAAGGPASYSPLLLSTHDTLQFHPESNHWLDVAEFLDLTGLTRTAGSALSGLEAATALYRGPFLEGLGIDSAAFEEWVLFRREQFDRQMIIALGRLATLYEAAGCLAEAIPHTRRLLEMDPWDEAAHRHLMRLLALDGQRAAALAQYKACCRGLAAELGLEPAAETVALAAAIREGRLAQASVEALVPARVRTTPSSAPPPPFVGRKQVLERLGGFLERALAGRAQVAFVTGEAGAGKTALLAEFAWRAMARHPVLVAAGGDCAALGGTGDPYLPFRDILEGLTGEVEGPQAMGRLMPEQARRLAALLPVTAQALCQVGPDLVGTFLEAEPLALRLQATLPSGSPWRAQLAERAEGARQGGTTPPGQAALFEQVTRLFQAVARQQPLLLTLDNLQWADPGTTSLLFHLGRRLGAGRVLIVGAYRPVVVALGMARPDGSSLSVRDRATEVATTHRHPLEPVLHELGRELGDMEVSLDEANDQAFVEAILDSEPNRLGAAFRRTLAEHTAGNPLFTVELLRSLEERGSLVRDATGHWVEGTALDWERLPARVEAVIAERVGRLPQACQEILSAASVEGVAFNAEVVACVLGLDRTQVVRQLSGPICQQHRLAYPSGLQWLGTGDRRLSRYRFRHYLFHSYLYQRLDEARRASLHEAVGAALEALHGEGVGEIAPRLAWHFERAGLASKAAGYLLQSAERAARLSAHEEAIALLRRGLALLQTLPDSPERARQELALVMPLVLGPSLLAMRGWGAAEHVEVCERAAHLCQQLGEDETLRMVLFQLGNLYQARRSAAPSASPFATRAGRQSGPSAQEAMHLLELGENLVFLAQSDAGRVCLERCLEVCRALPEQRLTSTGIDVEVVCCAWLMLVLWKQGYPDQARERSRQGLARARALHDPMSLGMASLACGLDLHVLRREPELVRQGGEQLMEMARAKGLVLFEGHALIRLGWARAMLGEIEPGMEAIRQGLAAAPLTAAAITRPYQLLLQADACLAASRAFTLSPGRAESEARPGPQSGAPGPSAATWAEEGLAVVAEGLALIDRTDLRHFEAEMWRLQGELLLMAGANLQKAKDSFRRALEVARGQGARLWELRAAAALVRLLEAEPGWADARLEARQALAEVYGWFTEGFDTPDLVEAGALLE